MRGLANVLVAGVLASVGLSGGLLSGAASAQAPGVRPQVIRVTSGLPAHARTGTTVKVAATGGGSSNPVTFRLGPKTTNGACTVDGARVRFVHAGRCVVVARQAGGQEFAPATPVRMRTGSPVFTGAWRAGGYVFFVPHVNATTGECTADLVSDEYLAEKRCELHGHRYRLVFTGTEGHGSSSPVHLVLAGSWFGDRITGQSRYNGSAETTHFTGTWFDPAG